MDTHSNGKSWKAISSASLLVVAASLLTGSPVPAQQRAEQQEQQQQVKITAPFAKAAFLSLLTIESEDLAAQDRTSEAAQMTATEKTIEAAKAEAVGREEKSITEMLGKLYSLKLRDNDLLRAYQKVIEIENADDAGEGAAVRRKKDDAVSQIADSIASITKREDACFGQLEESLKERSTEDLPACSAWILRGESSAKVQPQETSGDRTDLQNALKAGALEISHSIQSSQER